MAERHRLGRLQMGKARHDRAGMFFCAPDEGALQTADQTGRMVQCPAGPEAEIRHHLVIPRAGRVQAASRFPDNFLQPRLDIHVDVFKLAPERERAVAQLVQHLVQPGLNRLIVIERDDAHLRKHVCMGPASGDVFLSHPPVNIEGGVDFFHYVGRGRGKPSPPHRLAFATGHWHTPSTN